MTTPRDRVVFERHLYPIVLLRMPAAGPLAAVHAWYDEVEALLRAADTSLALIHDLRPLDLLSVTSVHRAAVAERTLRLRDAGLDRRLGADARIVSNRFVAGAVSAVSWITGSTPWPQATFANESEAIRWCMTALDLQPVSATGSDRSPG
jgi:hypothetical protein